MIENKYVHIKSDNVTGVTYINNFGGIKSVGCCANITVATINIYTIVART